MTTARFEHANEVRAALREIVAEHGPEALSRPAMMSSLLADLLPDAPRIARMLVAAAEDHIADLLREHAARGMDAATAARLAASSFASATMFDPEACAWVASELAVALHLTGGVGQAPVLTGPPAAMPPPLPEPQPGLAPAPRPAAPRSASRRARIIAIIVAAAVVTAAAILASGALRHAPASTGTSSTGTGTHPWGTATQVPGLAALSTGGNAGLSALSCPTAGSCTAGGYYTDSSHVTQAFVVTEQGGRWGTAVDVPGLAALNEGKLGAGVDAVSCAAPGSCAAGGTYTDRAGHIQVFVVTEQHGRWGTAIEVPGTAALNAGYFATRLSSVSCAAPGSCAAGGTYTDRAGHTQVFVVTEQHGRWGTAIEIPGSAALSRDEPTYTPVPGISSVSCLAPGNCAAGGNYIDRAGHIRAFVVTEQHGRWGAVIRVPGTAAANGSGNAPISGLSCAATGSCAAVGGADSGGAFVVTEQHGIWGTATQAPGVAALVKGGSATFDTVSCTAASACLAAGYSIDNSDHGLAFAATERNGRWGTATELPGTAVTIKGGFAGIKVSCATIDSCAAGLQYFDSSGKYHLLLAAEVNGEWHKTIEIPGMGALDQGQPASISSVSCPPDGGCAAVGIYTDRSTGHISAFVVSQS